MGLCCKLFSCLFSIIITLGIITLILYLVVRPSEVKSYVEATSKLTRFDLITNNTLDYTLGIDLSIRNPNKRVSIYYDRIQASASYDDSQFGFDSNLPKFHQGHKNTTIIHPAFAGQQIINDSSVVDTYNKEKDLGYFNIDLTIHLKMKYKALSFKTPTYKHDIKCNLRFHQGQKNNPAPIEPIFVRTKCHVNFFWDYLVAGGWRLAVIIEYYLIWFVHYYCCYWLIDLIYIIIIGKRFDATRLDAMSLLSYLKEDLERPIPFAVTPT